MPVIHEFAPAKLNLYLHITGRRADGYHDLDSLVAFASIGDHIRLEPANIFSFAIEGPQAEALQNESGDKNLVVRAAHLLAEFTGCRLECRITLTKNLPVASGIGGGSSDAAAALRALARYWKLAPNDPRLREAAIRLGQDILACLVLENNYLTADGTAPALDLPYADCVLVNPGKPLSTPAVYQACRESGTAFSPRAQLREVPKDLPALVVELAARGNDLYAPACRLMPEIHDIIAQIEETHCVFARMSGSGATCFGLYANQADARLAASAILDKRPQWWVAQASLPYKSHMQVPIAHIAV